MARVISPDLIATLTIYGEARGEPLDGKIGVAEVIRNRASRKYNSDGTIEGTCLRFAQFSVWWWKDPNLMSIMRADDTDQMLKDSARAWMEASNNDTDMTFGALLYANLDIVKPDWTTLCKKTVKIGRHTFFVPPVKRSVN